jgi:hypothetical protein
MVLAFYLGDARRIVFGHENGRVLRGKPRLPML